MKDAIFYSIVGALVGLGLIAVVTFLTSRFTDVTSFNDKCHALGGVEVRTEYVHDVCLNLSATIKVPK